MNIQGETLNDTLSGGAPWNIPSSAGLHLRHCGHHLHFDCFARYFHSLKHRHDQGLQYEGMLAG